MTGGVEAARLTMPAIDEGYAMRLTSAGTTAREVVQLAYIAGTNTTNSIPTYYLLASASGPGPSAGVYDLTTHDTFCVAIGPSGAQANVGPYPVWPTHPKQNLAGRFLIPPGYLLLVGPADANLDGTVVHTCITQEA